MAQLTNQLESACLLCNYMNKS